MINILICGHGTFAQGIYSTVKLIAAEQPNVQVVDFLEEDDSDSLKEKVTAAMTKFNYNDGIVCFTDLAGGTPFNVCSTLSATRENVRVIGGTNVPMLLSSMFVRELPIDQFVGTALEQGVENIKSFALGKVKTEVEEGI